MTNQDRMTKEEAGYVDSLRPARYYTCGDCIMFEGHGACTIVEGAIDRNGWCRHFLKDDRRRER